MSALAQTNDGAKASGENTLTEPAQNIILPLPKPSLHDEKNTAQPETSFFKIASGSTAGSYFATGERLAEIISHPPGAEHCADETRCGPRGMFAVAKNSDGAVVNIRAVNAGSLASGLAPADLLQDAYEGHGIFTDDGPLTQLRVIASLYPEALHLVTTKVTNINNLSDLKGMRISLGVVGSGSHSYAEQVISKSGLATHVSIETLDLYDAADQLLSGDIDAFFYLGGVPVPFIQDILTTGQVKLIPITGATVAGLYDEKPYTDPFILPSESYPNTPQIETIASTAYWIVDANISQQRVYRITAALWHEDNQDKLRATKGLLSALDKDFALRDLPIPLHPGAERYYREAGFFASQTDKVITGGITMEKDITAPATEQIEESAP